jgi:hypothetical protein
MRQFREGAITQLRNLWKILFFLYLPIALLFLIVGLLSRVVEDASLTFFLRDIAVTGHLPFFAGFVSQLGGMLWSAALTICVFALIVLERHTVSFAASKRLLLYSATFTIILLLDDIFLFHEEVAPEYLHLEEAYVIAGYMLFGIVFVLSNWQEILSSEYVILLLAFLLFAGSVVLDALPIDTLDVSYWRMDLSLPVLLRG